MLKDKIVENKENIRLLSHKILNRVYKNTGMNFIDLYEDNSLFFFHEKLFCLSAIKKKSICDEIRLILNNCYKLILDSVLNINEYEEVRELLKRQMLLEIEIFSNAKVLDFFSILFSNHGEESDIFVNHLSLIAKQAIPLFSYMMKFLDSFFHGSPYELLDSYIIQQNSFNHLFPPVFGDKYDAFGNNKISIYIYMVLILYDILLKKYKKLSVFDQFISEKIKIDDRICSKYLLKSKYISKIDYSTLFSNLRISVDSALDVIDLLSKSSLVSDVIDNNIHIIIPNAGYILGAQRFNSHLHSLVGFYRSTSFYSQDCSSLIASMLDFDYDKFDMSYIQAFSTIIFSIHVHRSNNPLYSSLDNMQNGLIINDYNYDFNTIINAIKTEDREIMKKIIANNSALIAILENKACVKWESERFLSNLKNNFCMNVLFSISKKIKTIFYASIHDIGVIRQFFMINKGKNMFINISKPMINKKFQGYESFLYPQICENAGFIVDFLSDYSLLYIAFAKLQSEQNNDSDEDSIFLGCTGGLSYQICDFSKNNKSDLCITIFVVK